ncbi:hypothetical protein MGU_10731 [Metarhizium guizhouense ARSEF 977]|uniref:Uncharacterized protein n=1 Tax=Metarhizium guizhouense (strain ARSEF 977) TaxID=1276136 RepID=A0A0B4GQA1_METGA|nr:hypothetical protein MGU_10731 [Metarhizium guizhouense ARSEF 977]
MLFLLLPTYDFNIARVTKVKEHPTSNPGLSPEAIPAPILASVAAGDSIASHYMPNAVLHVERKALVSSNGKWRVQLADDGELILETDRDGTWSPVWWTNSGRYRRKDAAPETSYMTIDVGGAVQILVRTMDEDRHAVTDRRWDSMLSGHCLPVEGDAMLLAAPAPQSLALDNHGRLLVFDGESKLTCVLYDDTSNQSPTLHQTVNFVIAEEEQPDPEQNRWPMFRNSDKLSRLQLRAMLEGDLAKTNKSLKLSREQLQTIFNNAIVLPSFRGHAEFCIKFLRSMIRHCVDCHLWQINLVLLKEDVEQFSTELFGADVAAITKSMHKVLLQGFKKMYDCLATGKRYCFLLDSEGIMLGTTWLADIVKEFLENPFAIHTPESRNGSSHPIDWSPPCADMLRVDNFSSAGWLLEYYLWVFDSRVYAEIARIYAQSWPQLKGNPQEVFFEVCYFAYIWAKKGPVEGPAYRFITSKQLLGQRLWNLMWPRHVYETGADPNERVNGLAIIEDVREWLTWFPNLLVPVAEVWERNQMRLFKAGQDWWQAMSFLSVAKSVRMCVTNNRETFGAQG